MDLTKNPSTFIAQGLQRAKQRGANGTSGSLRLTTIGIALSLSVMLLSVAIILGFREQIHEFAFSQTGHISLNSYGSNWRNSNTPVKVSNQLLNFLRCEPYIERVMPIVQEAGLLKTEEDFSGILLYGIDPSFKSDYFVNSLREGRLPNVSPEAIEAPEIALPTHVADRMGCELGEKVRIYFFGDKMRVRVYTLVGIYESTGLELSPALCPMISLQRLNQWGSDSYSRLMIMLRHPGDAEKELNKLITRLQAHPDLIANEDYGMNLGQELQPELFNWLTFLDTNVYALLGLMILVAGFSMITGLIILVLDKSRQIGILKALGATNSLLRKVFLLLSGHLILRGMIWGNVLALILCLLQKQFKIIHLNPANYFMSSVPIHFDLLAWIGINLGTLLLILLMVLVPAGLVSRIRPAESMRID